MKLADIKQKARHELAAYALNVLYLSLVFGAFTEYKRLMLAAHEITYKNYGVSIIEALILAKAISYGSILRIARGLEAKPLIYPTIYKAAVFCVFVAAFKILERGVKGWVMGDGFAAGVNDMWKNGPHEALANALVIFVALLPFFAVKELGRVLGQKKIVDLFFRPRVEA